MVKCVICNKEIVGTPNRERVEDHGNDQPVCDNCCWPMICPCGCTFVPLNEDHGECPECGSALERVR